MSGLPSAPTRGEHEARLLLAATAQDVGDRRTTRPCSSRRCGASAARRRGERQEGAARCRPRALPRRQRPRGARVDREALGAAGASSSCTSSCCTTSSPADARPRRLGAATWTRWSAATARRAPARLRRRRGPHPAALGDAAGGVPARRRRARPATGLIVHSHYVESRARDGGFDGPVWRIPHPAWPRPGRPGRSAEVEGSPLIGCFGHLNESKRLPQLLARVRRLRARHPDATLLLVGARRRLELSSGWPCPRE